ncbi:MAG TPA: hypothetical protein V6C81_27760 [Planktothrix sp.]|jgi:hypothetical protein
MKNQTEAMPESDSHSEWEALGAIEIVQKDVPMLSSLEEEDSKEEDFEYDEDDELKGQYLDYEDYCYRRKLVGIHKMLAIKLKDYPDTELLYPQDKPVRPILSPSDTVALLKYALDSRLIKELLITDYLNEDEIWFKQTTEFTYSPGQIAIEAKGRTKRLTMYRPQSLENALEPFDREWLTMLHLLSHPPAAAFRQVEDLEELVSNAPNPENPHMLDAAWCWFGLMILTPQPAVTLVIAEQDPIRTSIVAMAIKERLLTVPPQIQSARHDQILSRCKYISEQVVPNAVSALKSRLTSASQEQIVRINVILEYLQKIAAANGV